jgi:hypothetical protein
LRSQAARVVERIRDRAKRGVSIRDTDSEIPASERGVFTSTRDLDKKLMCYIRQYNKQAAPLKGSTPAPNAASGAIHPA